MFKRTSKDTSAVKKSILIAIAYQNLLHKRLRTTLTVLGIAIGIGAIYFLLSFGLGLQNLVTNEIIGNQSIKTIDVASTNSQVLKLDDLVVQRIKKIQNVSDLSSVYFYPSSYRLSGSESDAVLYGIDKAYVGLTYLNILEGEMLDFSDTNSRGVVLNKAALESIGLDSNDREVVGTKLTIIIPAAEADGLKEDYSAEFTVTGVIDSGSGAELFINGAILRSLGITHASQLKIGSSEVESIADIRTQIESFGFETTSPTDTLSEINVIFRYLNLLLIGFGGIGMIVAILGMFNTLTISLLERTKEIGLMVALGARSVDIKLLFIFEALLLSAIGSTVGIFGAYLLGRGANVVVNILASSRGVQDSFDIFSNPPLLILGLFFFMLIVGSLVVFIPARRAQRINPILALRSE